MLAATRAEGGGESEGEDTDDKEKEKEPYKAKTCNDCNRQFCVALDLPICKGATDEDVKTSCFRTSPSIPCACPKSPQSLVTSVYFGFGVLTEHVLMMGVLLHCRTRLKQGRGGCVHFHHSNGIVTGVGALATIREQVDGGMFFSALLCSHATTLEDKP